MNNTVINILLMLSGCTIIGWALCKYRSAFIVLVGFIGCGLALTGVIAVMVQQRGDIVNTWAALLAKAQTQAKRQCHGAQVSTVKVENHQRLLFTCGSESALHVVTWKDPYS